MFLIKAIGEAVFTVLFSFFLTFLLLFCTTVVFSGMWGGYPGCSLIQRSSFSCTFGVPNEGLIPIVVGGFAFFNLVFFFFRGRKQLKRFFLYGLLLLSLISAILMLIDRIRAGTSMI